MQHGHGRLDEYHWLRASNWPKPPAKNIINYLKAENAYTREFFKPLKKGHGANL